ncbi:bifunctional diaminohydroxyphosphoribosylaminopyrimidine deaminase/5-amino-6-(5-phosphoribosylamino)uracil reductase RibD [Oryzobacter telluris]|uniref:bifunctional diaminohydroxyphosphoribosylaminopyrimidine deaminase/5-amino-6-(5-phosphoribosylamino)uracil reductase RibD n=1 Tax=Oryzobacter telluris TaxID=3149179 RepID=UPI00370D760A
MDEHTALMQRALDAARLGPESDPNPRVGCVVTDRGGRVIGIGHHRGAGTPHAEVDALARAGEAARGGTALVTLEPCDHTGRTGPCTDALLAAGVARVRYAVADPDPTAAGGAAHLGAAGVDVAEVADPAVRAEAEALNATWLHARRTGRPFVTWKTATTLDGRTAAPDGTSRWITGAEARADVHALRSRVGAVLVGTGTALADDPALTVRDADGHPAAHQPWRVVAGTRALPEDARLLDDSAPTLVVASRDPREVLDALVERGVHHLLLEGGATLAAAFLRAGLVDEVVAYVAPTLLGAGPSAVGDLGIGTIADALHLETTDVTVLGGDVRITARPVRPHPTDRS